MTTASRPLATALWGARFAGVWLPSCYTTWGDTILQHGHWRMLRLRSPPLQSTPGVRVPWAFSRVRRIAVLGPRPPRTGAGLLRLGFRQCYARLASNAEKFCFHPSSNRQLTQRNKE